MDKTYLSNLEKHCHLWKLIYNYLSPLPPNSLARSWQLRGLLPYPAKQTWGPEASQISQYPTVLDVHQWLVCWPKIAAHKVLMTLEQEGHWLQSLQELGRRWHVPVQTGSKVKDTVQLIIMLICHHSAMSVSGVTSAGTSFRYRCSSEAHPSSSSLICSCQRQS